MMGRMDVDILECLVFEWFVRIYYIFFFYKIDICCWKVE